MASDEKDRATAWAWYSPSIGLIRFAASSRESLLSRCGKPTDDARPVRVWMERIRAPRRPRG